MQPDRGERPRGLTRAKSQGSLAQVFIMSKKLEIKGINKLRDYKICSDYIANLSPEEILKKRNLSLSTRRIFQILYDNAAFINPLIAWPKTRRIQLRQRILQSTPEKSKKDIVDQLNDLTREIEGNTPLIDNSQHSHFTIEIKTDDKNDRSPVALQTESSLGRSTEE